MDTLVERENQARRRTLYRIEQALRRGDNRAALVAILNRHPSELAKARNPEQETAQ